MAPMFFRNIAISIMLTQCIHQAHGERDLEMPGSNRVAIAIHKHGTMKIEGGNVTNLTSEEKPHMKDIKKLSADSQENQSKTEPSSLRRGPILPPEALRTTLALATEWFQEANISFIAFFGTALQLLRDGALRKHDDDVDLLISPDDYFRVEQMLGKHGYYFHHFDGYPMIQVGPWPAGLVGGIPGGALLDIYVDTGDADTVCVLSDRKAFPHSYVYPTVTKSLVLNGKTFEVRVPGQAEKFLTAAYGNAWSTPMDSKGSAKIANDFFYSRCSWDNPLPKPSRREKLVQVCTDSWSALFTLTWRQDVLICLTLMAVSAISMQLQRACLSRANFTDAYRGFHGQEKLSKTVHFAATLEPICLSTDIGS